jgi:hypothetical protein
MSNDPRYLISARVQFAEEESRSFGMTIARTGSVVFPKAGGAIATNKKRSVRVEGAIDLNCMAVTAGPDVDAEFLYWWFQQVDIASLSDGSILPQLSKKTISALEMPVPPLDEQHRIVEALEALCSRLDAGGASLNRVAQLNRTMRSSAIDAVITRATGWGTSAPRFDSISMDALGSDGLFTDGDWVESKDQDPNGQIRLTQLADVGEGKFRDRSDRWLNEEQAARLNVTPLQPNDLLIARMPDPMARSCLVPEDIGRAVTVVDVAILRILRPDFDPRYAMWAINSAKFRAMALSVSSGTTRLRISRKNLGTLEIPAPPLDVQRVIVSDVERYLSVVDAMERSCTRNAVGAAALRRSILHAAFSGRLQGANRSE